MTLYLLFERLDAGKIKLDTPLKVSEHAAAQAPTKLGLKPGQTLAVEDAIKGVVTKSANDAAVTIAENLGGDEDGFARLMTQKARALGMTRTTYVNASGLPDDDQLTTARDQALLGRAIQERFPRYYKYFSTEAFVYHGEAMRNHNHLLGAIEGVDGIKTGFTRASGFNLVTSVHRDGRYIVAVVMGGHSAFERDAHMRQLIVDHIKEAALRRSAPAVAEQHDDTQPAAFAKAPLASHADPEATATVDAHVATGSNDPIRPLLVKTITFRTVPMQSAALAPMPALVPVVAPASQSSARQAAVHSLPAAPPADQRTVVASAEPTPAPQAMATPATTATATESAPPATAKAEPAKLEPAKVEPIVAPTKVEIIPRSEVPASVPAAHAHSGWLIQIGAFDGDCAAAAPVASRAASASAAASLIARPSSPCARCRTRCRWDRGTSSRNRPRRRP